MIQSVLLYNVREFSRCSLAPRPGEPMVHAARCCSPWPTTSICLRCPCGAQGLFPCSPCQVSEVTSKPQITIGIRVLQRQLQMMMRTAHHAANILRLACSNWLTVSSTSGTLNSGSRAPSIIVLVHIAVRAAECKPSRICRRLPSPCFLVAR